MKVSRRLAPVITSRLTSVAKIAVEGCCHGEVDAIYDHISALQSQTRQKIDFLLICGDFQAIRNHQDLQCMAVPLKFRRLGGFCKYYTGEKRAPILTLVIGGNHEASNYMWELYHGGWLAPNIYFLGNAGCVQVNGIRICGMSGIFNEHHYNQGFFESLPYSHSAMRSIYHIREYNHRRLSLLSRPDIFMSHDWPASIEHHGDIQDLLRRKPFFREDIKNKALGSPPLLDLLQVLKPNWWFSAHLHVKYDATFIHKGPQQALPTSPSQMRDPNEIVIDDEDENIDAGREEPAQNLTHASRNPDEITLDDEEAEVAAVPVPLPPPIETRFLALDKYIPKSRRQFLEVIDIPAPVSSSPPRLTFDPEWLAITRAYHPYMSTSSDQIPYPDAQSMNELVARELEWVKSHVLKGGKLEISEVQVFEKTAPGPSPETQELTAQPKYFPNPQTAAFCAMLEIENKVDKPNMLWI